MSLPASSYLENSGRTVAEMKQALEDQRDAISKLRGAGPRTELTISAGVITPGARDHGGIFTIDTEGGGASDDVDVMALTNWDEGAIYRFYAENASRVVTLKEGNGGTGQILTTDGADFVFGGLADWIDLQRRTSDLVEVDRNVVVAGFVDNGTPGRLKSVQTFTSNGTWTKPAGLRFAIVKVIGGGGGGAGAASGGSSGGGAGGGYAEKKIATASLSGTESVTVGTGGSGGSAGANNGAAGNTSSFGSHCSATGGGAGTHAGGGNTALGGIGSSGDLNVRGGPSGVGTPSTLQGGQGGNTVLGGGGQGGATSAGGNGGAYGGGGGGASGASATARAGGDGAAGVVIVEEYF